MTGETLDDFIASSVRGASGPCTYVRSTTPEQRAAIRAKVEAGLRPWAPVLRWLRSQGVDITRAQLVGHFDRGHNDETCH